MLPILLSVLGPLFGKIIDTVGEKIGVDMNSDELKGKRLEIDSELQRMLHQLDLKELESRLRQIDLNIEEAKNPGRKWPTWRESLGYVCVAAVAYHFVIQQFLAFLLAGAGIAIALPALDMTGIMTILTAMLGVHYVDSRFNSPIGAMPQPAADTRSGRPGRLVTDENGDTVWRFD